MRKYLFHFSIIIGQIISLPAYSCTNLLVSKGASADGSSMISYAADSHILYGELYYRPAKDYPAGTTMEIYDWDSTKYLGKIRQALHTFSVIGNMNEHQLTIGETTYGGKEELQDWNAKLDYGGLIYITLQRARTARAAIDTINNLLNENGYHSVGETFSIADPNEVWIMDIIGKGSPQKIKDKNGKVINVIYNKGAVWVARRVPDGYICAHANQSRIQQFPLNDPENCKYAPDVISFAHEKGWFKGEDKDFSFAATYAPLTFEGLRFCEGRVYSMFRRAAPSLNISADYVKGVEGAEPLPLWIKPDKKISVKDAMALMRDHYEGTDLDMTNDAGAGPFHCPYRWRPLTWKVDSVEYFNERAISTQQTGFSFVTQSRGWMPDCVGGLVWFGVDDTYSTVYCPIYCSMTVVPNSFAEGNGNFYKYSETSAFWAFNAVSNWAYTRYSDMITDIQKVQKDFETKFIILQPAVEKAALELINSGQTNYAIQYLNDYSVNQAENVTTRWKELGHDLLVKYMDGNVKDDKGNVTHPPYPKGWYKNVIQNTGDKLKMKKLKGEPESH
jgi:dipeptidase